MIDFQMLAQPGIRGLRAYDPGHDLVALRRAAAQPPLELGSNENPYGASPAARQAVVEALATLHVYPDPLGGDLKRALARHHGVDTAQILLGNGSHELLMQFAQVFAGAGDEVVASQYGFAVYALAAQAAGATLQLAPALARDAPMPRGHDLDALRAAVTPRTRLVYLANPNNPTGTYLSADEVKRLRAGLRPDILLVIDAAYAEFVSKNDYTPGIELVDAHDNTVMCRTFSKIFALGGLRLGWAYCPVNIADVLNRVRNPFNVAAPSLAAGEAALADTGFFELTKTHNDYWLPWMLAELAKLGLPTTPSVCNFVLIQFPKDEGRTAQAADSYLRAQGIITRAMGGYGLGEWLRVTIGTGEENQAVIEALAAFKASWS